MHSRDRREFGRRKMRVRNRWEVVLVLMVIAAGIVITTVAAIKAKERRQMESQTKSVHNSTKSSVSHVREVLNTQSTDQNNRKVVPALENAVKRPKVAENQPDYDVEYDLVKSGVDEYTAMASETIDTLPRNRVRVNHDGLPGFPPPFGISSDFNSNVELSADAAGFVLETADHTNEESNRDEVEFKDVLPKTFVHSNSERNSNQKTNSIKTSIKLNNNNVRKSESKIDSIAAKPEPKRIPIFVDPPKDHIETKVSQIHSKPIESKPDMKVAIPMKVFSRLPISKERMSILGPGGSEPMRFALPNLEPAIRFLGMSDDFHHTNDQQFHGSMHNIPIGMRRFLPEGDNPESVPNQSGHQNSGPPKMRTKRESERRFSLRHYKRPTSSSIKIEFKENEPKTGESRYYPFNDRSFISDNEDHHREDSEHEDESIRPLFNFDDIENRFPSVLSSTRDHKRNDDNYSSEESREKHKYGILGSGNFEIIRGGVYAEEESASNNSPNYVQESDSDSNNENQNYDNQSNNEPNSESNNENSNRKSEPEAHSLHNYPDHNSEPNSEDDSEPNSFSPFNIDFFTGRPILGFQGYDNFGATNVDKFKAPAEPTSSKGQRRHFYDPFSADSNLHVISTDQDLYSDS